MPKYATVRLDKNGNVLFSEYHRVKVENLTKAEAVHVVEDILVNSKETNKRRLASQIINSLFRNAIKEI